MKKLLFYFTTEIAPSAGGVERVVALQYQELTNKGYLVFIVYGQKCNVPDSIPNQYQLPIPEQLNSLQNITFIQNFIKKFNIDVAFNFAAIFNSSSLCLVEACKQEKTPIISVLHNTLEFPLWNIPVARFFMKQKTGRQILTWILGIIQRFDGYKGGLYLYKNSAATVVLAPCYIKEYQKMICKHASNILAIYNPLPISIHKIAWEQRENIVLFIGRLEKQKSIDKLIHIWAKINVPSWKLCIVGTGSQETSLKQLTKKLNVNHSVSFEGHQNPIPYYCKAKIFCLTSIYEGYPMTLIECQACGVVPVIYDSFPAAQDIVNTGHNGVLIPAFQQKKYCDKLQELMANEAQLKKMSNQCYSEMNKYSLDRIMTQWINLLEQI